MKPPEEKFTISLTESSSTPPVLVGSMASARFCGRLADDGTWVAFGGAVLEMYGSVDGIVWVSLGVTITGGGDANQTSELIDIRGYQWIKVAVTTQQLAAANVTVGISTSPYRVDEVHSIPVLSAPPTDGSVLYFDSVYDMLVHYDAGRAKWLGPLMTYTFGKNTSVSSGETLKSQHGLVVPSSSRGWMTGRAMTCVGMEASTNGAFTGSFELTEDSAGTGQALPFVAASSAQDYTIDYDWTASKHLGCQINITSGSPTNPAVTIYNRWKVA